MAFLLDTNVVAELRRKRRNERAVQTWLASVKSDDLFTSVIVIGEIGRGIEKIRPNDPAFASRLENWLRIFQTDYKDRILAITEQVAELWGTLCPKNPLPEPDGLIAATAMYHRMTLVTRNVQHVARSGVHCLNPWVRT